MKKIIIFFFLIFFIFNFQQSFANEKNIAYVNLDYLIKNSNVGKNVLEKIKNLDQDNIKKLELKNNELKKIELELQSKQNIISEQAFNEEVKKLQDKINLFNEEKKQMVKKFTDFKNNELQNVFKSITPIIKNYMEQNSINIILNSKDVVMADTNLDITKIILNEINKKPWIWIN